MKEIFLPNAPKMNVCIVIAVTISVISIVQYQHAHVPNYYEYVPISVHIQNQT